MYIEFISVCLILPLYMVIKVNILIISIVFIYVLKPSEQKLFSFKVQTMCAQRQECFEIELFDEWYHEEQNYYIDDASVPLLHPLEGEPVMIMTSEIFFKIWSNKGEIYLSYSGAKNEENWPYQKLKFEKFIKKELSEKIFCGRPSGIYNLQGWNDNKLNKDEKLYVSKYLFPEIVENISNDVPLSNLIIYEQDWDCLTTPELIKFAQSRGIETVFQMRDEGPYKPTSYFNWKHFTVCQKCTYCPEISLFRNKLIDSIKQIRKSTDFIQSMRLLVFGWIRLRIPCKIFILIPQYLKQIIETYFY